MCKKTRRCWVSSPMLISKRKLLAFAPRREGGEQDTEVAAEVGESGEGSSLEFRTIYFTASETEAAAEAEPRVTPNLFRIYQDSPDKPPFIPDFPPFIFH